jgi:hypothetical protein
MLLLIRGEKEEELHALTVTVTRDVTVPTQLFAGVREAKRGDSVDRGEGEDDLVGRMASITRPRNGNHRP